MQQQLVIINGPNLNMLGNREPSIYGKMTLSEIKELTEEKLKSKNISLFWFQSNIEGEIITKIQEIASQNVFGLIINPGAFSHTSIGILDALNCLAIPIVEVHLSNVYKRESFRQNLLTAKASTIIMSGLKEQSYYHAALALLNLK